MIAAFAESYALPAWTGVPAAVWLEAQTLQESSGNPKARRYEPALDTIADGDVLRTDDGLFEDSASWGLLQILGSNARAQLGIAKGTRMSFEFLTDPVLGLAFGSRHLVRECFSLHPGNVAAALAVFNAGPRGADLIPEPGGPVGPLVMRNEAYVAAVKRRIPAVLAEARDLG